MTVLRTARGQREPIRFERPILVLVEGVHDQAVVCRTIADERADRVHVHAMGGKDRWSERLRLFAVDPTFEDHVETVALVRDCDDDSNAALQSCVQALANAPRVSTPSDADVMADDEPVGAAVHLVPAHGTTGALEELILPSLEPGRVACARAHVDCLVSRGVPIGGRGKATLGSYLVGLEKPRVHITNVIDDLEIEHSAFDGLRSFLTMIGARV